jgi:hypothetical protein
LELDHDGEKAASRCGLPAVSNLQMFGKWFSVHGRSLA